MRKIIFLIGLFSICVANTACSTTRINLTGSPDNEFEDQSEGTWMSAKKTFHNTFFWGLFFDKMDVYTANVCSKSQFGRVQITRSALDILSTVMTLGVITGFQIETLCKNNPDAILKAQNQP